MAEPYERCLRAHVYQVLLRVSSRGGYNVTVDVLIEYRRYKRRSARIVVSHDCARGVLALQSIAKYSTVLCAIDCKHVAGVATQNGRPGFPMTDNALIFVADTGSPLELSSGTQLFDLIGPEQFLVHQVSTTLRPSLDNKLNTVLQPLARPPG